jgi:dTDP-glucose pyrophosphorylase
MPGVTQPSPPSAAHAGSADRLDSLLIGDGASIRDAMAAIDANGREVVVVQDADGRIVGLVTDGDIRRGILAGQGLEASVATVMTQEFFAVPPGVDRAAVLDLMKARDFRHIPVLDGAGRLAGLHFLRDLIGATRKPNVAVIMCGGFGTRLRPITETIPKPMVEVAGRPMLERIVLHLVGHGVTRIHLAVNYLSETIESHFGDGSSFGCEIEYLREHSPLGTGGPLALLDKRPEHPFFVLNGDQVTRADLSAMLAQHLARGHSATIGIGAHQVQIPYGVISSKGGLVTALEEKPTLSLMVNRGIYVLNPETLDHVPTDQEFPITALFERLLELKRPVGAYLFEDYWLDVGAVADLRTAHGLAS